MVTLFVLSVFVVILILFFGRNLKPVWRFVIVALAFLLINMPIFVYLVIGDRGAEERAELVGGDEDQVQDAAEQLER